MTPPERRTAGKGAPVSGAAERTLAREHRCGIPPFIDGRLWRVGRPILLVGFEQRLSLVFQRFFLPSTVRRKRNDSVPVSMM